ncbi:MAG TPA: MFS transporter, partial [Desulfobacteria bacterium]|nr:MFS transporter [Desulfobacteria bacterium]
MLRSQKASFSKLGLLILGFTALAIANGTRQGYGVFLPALVKELGASNAKLAGAFSIIHLFNGFLAPMVGKSIDLYSPRRIFLTGSFLVGTAFGLLGLVKELWQIYVIVILVMAPGISCIGLTAVNTLISRSFNERRGAALGF